MSMDSKAAAGVPAPPREKGVRIFTYPKIIFIFPTLIMALICWIGMYTIRDVPDFNYERAHRKETKAKAAEEAKANPTVDPGGELSGLIPQADPVAFKRKENVLALLFLAVFFLNLLILAVDFPRFAIFAIVLGVLSVTFFLLWLGVFYDFIRPLARLVQGIYILANAEFYLLTALTLLLMYGIIFTTRWLDYWEILPNEILHHHGPLSDLERYPTLNLKFDKEIPDVFEHLMFGAGRLVLHVSDERKAIVLDTVLHVSRKEEGLKKLMSRLEVRVTTDQEVAAP